MPRFVPGDTVFLNARVIDGTGGPSAISSVHVHTSSIRDIFDSSSLSTDEQQELAQKGVKVIDCNDGAYVLAPGLIDMHAHSDLGLMHTPSHLAKITQGVTTEVIGQDGIGYAPVDDKCLGMIRSQIAGWNGNPDDAGFWKWHSVREYLDTLDERRPATNPAFLVPQGNLRMLVLGYDPREATRDEISQMQKILVAAMEDGAVGMSSGLTYVPGMYAPDSELAALLPIVAKYGGYYSPHHRSYGKGAMKAYQEMIDLAELTGTRLHLTHAILNFDENRGKGKEFLAMLDAARAKGVHITLDTYPYLPGSTTLAAQLPSWCASGGPEETMARLQEHEMVEKIRYDVEVVGTDGCHGCTIDWDTIEISGVKNPELVPIVGRTIGQLVSDIESHNSPSTPKESLDAVNALGIPLPLPTGFDVMVRILLEDQLATAILQHVGHEENVRAIMTDTGHCGGSDGILTSTKPHPRAWGTFTRYLGHYTRELPQGRERDIYYPGEDERYKQVEPLSVFKGGLEETIAHLTSRPAAVLRLTDRGLIEKGKKADIIVFDPDSVRDNSTFAYPTRPSRGIRFLLVNGQMAIEEGRPTHIRAGRTIRMRDSPTDGSQGKWVVA